MSEHIEVRIDTWPPGNQTTVPCNLQMRHEDGWVSLGTLGTTQYGGPNAEEKAVAYRKAVWQVAQLFLAAPELLAALDDGLEVVAYLAEVALGEHDSIDAERVRKWSIQAREALREAKGES